MGKKSLFSNLSRRQFVGAVGAGAIAAGCATDVMPPVVPEAPGGGGTDTIDPDPGTTQPEVPVEPTEPTNPTGPTEPTGPTTTSDEALKAVFLNRTSFGPTVEEQARYDEIGLAAYLEEQLHPEQIVDPDDEIDALLAPLWTLRATPAELFDVSVYPQSKTTARQHVARAQVIHAALSRRQLFERMVEFWSDHFNISIKRSIAFTVIPYNEDVIRVHALGNFRELLTAVAKHPAMLEYLDNAVNQRNLLNENYARELLELHTVGQNQGYTYQDIIMTAKALTGWRPISHWSYEPIEGRFQFGFHSVYHDQSFKVIMGLQIPAGGGIEDGEMLLDFLARHPFTAVHLATKLLKAFICENPTQPMIAAVANAYLASDCDIKSTLRAVFSTTNLSAATPLLCRPFHLLIKTIRQTGASIDSTAEVEAPLEEMGHFPNNWITPDGYPINKEFWASGILDRWNFTFRFAKNEYAGFNLPLESTFGPSATSGVDATIDYWNSRHLMGKMKAAERTALTNYANSVRGGIASGDRDVFGMFLTSPSYQMC